MRRGNNFIINVRIEISSCLGLKSAYHSGNRRHVSFPSFESDSKNNVLNVKNALSSVILFNDNGPDIHLGILSRLRYRGGGPDV
jgi:hypothetical protein